MSPNPNVGEMVLAWGMATGGEVDRLAPYCCCTNNSKLGRGASSSVVVVRMVRKVGASSGSVASGVASGVARGVASGVASISLLN